MCIIKKNYIMKKLSFQLSNIIKDEIWVKAKTVLIP